MIHYYCIQIKGKVGGKHSLLIILIFLMHLPFKIQIDSNENEISLKSLNLKRIRFTKVPFNLAKIRQICMQKQKPSHV